MNVSQLKIVFFVLFLLNLAFSEDLMFSDGTQTVTAATPNNPGLYDELDPNHSEPACPHHPDVFRFDNPIRIGAWNLQKLGKAKVGKLHVMEYILQVMLRYDIIAIQEVTDSTENAPIELLQALNEFAYEQEAVVNPDDALKTVPYDTYDLELSKRLGRNRYKEQYAFYYRVNRVSVNQTFQYSDPTDIFQIEPFAVMFNSPSTICDNFAVMAIHTSPDDAVIEIDALTDAYDDLVEKTGLDDVLIMGDFNAGCNYVLGKEFELIRLYNESRFTWLIDDHTDTTAKGTTCPYDRIVVSGATLPSSVYKNSAAPYYFDTEYNITDQDLVEDISDHYPVEILLKPNSELEQEAEIFVSVGITVKVLSSDRTCMKRALKPLLSNALNTCTTPDVYSTGRSIMFASFQSRSVEEILRILQSIHHEHGCLFIEEVESVLSYKLDHGALQDAALFGEVISEKPLDMTILCLVSEETCRITVDSTSHLVG